MNLEFKFTFILRFYNKHSINMKNLLKILSWFEVRSKNDNQNETFRTYVLLLRVNSRQTAARSWSAASEPAAMAA